MPSSGPLSSKQARRARISEVATTLFLERGFDAVSIADIAARAGVSKMTVTNHFPLKDDLVFDDFPEELDQVAAALEPCRDLRAAVDALEGYCRGREQGGSVARALAGDWTPQGFAPFARLVLSSRTLTARFHAHYRELGDVIDRALDRALDRHPGREDAEIAAWLMAECVHLVDWWPFRAVAEGHGSTRIARGRPFVRERAFAALRTGILAVG